MNALVHPKSGYPLTNPALRPQRSMEYEAFARISRNLSIAWPNRKENFPAFAKALNDNLFLWSTLAADVANPQNLLPLQLRAQIFFLYEFTAQHSAVLLSGKGSMTVLIDINTAIMRGLRGQGGGA